MQAVMFLVLLLLRMIADIVALLMADLAIHFGLLLLGIFSNGSGSSESNLDKWLNTHMYHRWTGVWACFLLQLMLCASIDAADKHLPADLR